ncbi:MAG: type II toxin-antitoxin system CcdA family antitoxin [Treponema sp.]|jgi:metal-responsive CopG/Arc/MetJ family transcriptional regulator|nr:type II toxin-antitoxin system CcdA family antitoxin [Treponema sp.]
MITKRKTSVSLSQTLLDELDSFNKKGNVSEFVEEALVFYLTELKRSARRQRDIEIINRNAELLNKGAEENLEFQDLP